MQTRIDHATVITCRDGQPVVLEDTSITLAGATISDVQPTCKVESTPPSSTARMPPIELLKGRPLGQILIEMGKVTRAQVHEALEAQKATHGVIGQTLVQMGYVTEQDVELALAAQAGREMDLSSFHVIDGRGKLVIPGLVNTHHHLYQSLTRCMPAVQNAGLFDWLTALYPIWSDLDYAALKQAAIISLAELLISGCTTTVDHMYLFPQDRDVKIEAVLEAAETLGMRIHACRGSMSLGRSAGGLPPDACVQTEDEILADCRRVIDRFHDADPLAMRKIDLAPCSPFSITPELLDETRRLAEATGVILHTHAAETLDEEQFCLNRFGLRPIEYLHRHGWLGPNTYLAHCVHLDDREIALLAESGTGVAHCPCSNMRLGSGIAPIRKMLDAGVKVGLAVDGSSSSDGGNLLAEAREALLLQRVLGGASALTTAEAFRLATTGGAAVLNRPKLGRIERGATADLAIYDAGTVDLAGAVVQDPLGALLLCHAPHADCVIINGETVLQDGRPTGLDLRGLVAEFNELVRSRFRQHRT